MIFTDDNLKKLIIPLIMEQFLVVAMGMADTIMVAGCGETAVSGISLVDAICVLLIGLFTAMASGGAVVVAQYLGKQDMEMVKKASNQLFLAIGAVSLLFMVAALAGNRMILQWLYGSVEPEVMNAARTYFFYAALSFPFLGIYNGGAALFRAVGNSGISMKVSFVANGLNVAGNALLIYGFRMGVTGAAIATLGSRIVASVVIMGLLLRSKGIGPGADWMPDWHVLKKILYIGIPSGVENSVFQLGKLLLSSLIAGFGTAAITADAVMGSLGAVQLIPTTAIGVGMLTVVGRCIGARDEVQAKYYLKKLLKAAYVCVAVLGVVMIVCAKPICACYHLSEETTRITMQLLVFQSICAILVHPASFALANGLRAANDVRYTMTVSVCTMWVCRIVLAYILSVYFELGIMGVWIAMTTDWAVRACFFVNRVRSGKWTMHMNQLTRDNE